MVLGIDERINGVNLGNWLVLEKWMDPEPFVRTAEDDEIWMHRTHGALWSERNLAEELRRHRDAYITLEDFRIIADHGLNLVRIPVPYFIFGDWPGHPGCHRVVPIPAPVCRLIREHIDRFCPDRDPDTMLFHAVRHPERVLNPTTIQRQFRTARKRINREDVTFHSLRATHATMFMIQGGTLRETMDELGHVDVDVAVRCYQRVVPRHRRDVAERLALEYLPAGDPAGIKAQIAQKEEEIDQLRQTVAGLRRRLEELEDDGRERNQAG